MEPQEIGERQALLGDAVLVDIPLSMRQILINFKAHLDKFEACDYEAGVWAYQQIASKLLLEQELPVYGVVVHTRPDRINTQAS